MDAEYFPLGGKTTGKKKKKEKKPKFSHPTFVWFYPSI